MLSTSHHLAMRIGLECTSDPSNLQGHHCFHNILLLHRRSTPDFSVRCYYKSLLLINCSSVCSVILSSSVPLPFHLSHQSQMFQVFPISARCSKSFPSVPDVPSLSHQGQMFQVFPISARCSKSFTSVPDVPSLSHQCQMFQVFPISARCSKSFPSVPDVPSLSHQCQMFQVFPISARCSKSFPSVPDVPSLSHQCQMFQVFPISARCSKSFPSVPDVPSLPFYTHVKKNSCCLFSCCFRIHLSVLVILGTSIFVLLSVQDILITLRMNHISAAFAFSCQSFWKRPLP